MNNIDFFLLEQSEQKSLHENSGFWCSMRARLGKIPVMTNNLAKRMPAC
jgi:hypothetical protein